MGTEARIAMTLGSRHMMAVVVLALAAACTTSNPTRQDQVAASSGQPSPEQAKELDLSRNGDPEDVVCERKQVTGSRFPQKVCMTRAMWQDRNDAGKDAVDTINRKSLGMCVTNAGGGCGG